MKKLKSHFLVKKLIIRTESPAEQRNNLNPETFFDDLIFVESHRDERNSSSQAEMNYKINKLQTEMNIRTLLATLTQQVISRPDEGNAPRASN